MVASKPGPISLSPIFDGRAAISEVERAVRAFAVAGLEPDNDSPTATETSDPSKKLAAIQARETWTKLSSHQEGKWTYLFGNLG